MPDPTDRNADSAPDDGGMDKTGGYRPLNEGYRPVGDGYQPGREEKGYTPTGTQTTSQLPTPPTGGSGESGQADSDG